MGRHSRSPTYPTARIADNPPLPLLHDPIPISFPVLVFFGTDGNTETYEGDLIMDDIRDFLVERVGEPGQLKALRPLLDKFLLPANAAKRSAIVEETEKEVAKLSTFEAGYGKWYVKIMGNVVKKGDEYIGNEFSRLLRIVYEQAESLKEQKLEEFRARLVVLKDFDSKLAEAEKAKKAEMKLLKEADSEAADGTDISKEEL